jgi:hypothetical protein
VVSQQRQRFQLAQLAHKDFQALMGNQVSQVKLGLSVNQVAKGLPARVVGLVKKVLMGVLVRWVHQALVD